MWKMLHSAIAWGFSHWRELSPGGIWECLGSFWPSLYLVVWDGRVQSSTGFSWVRARDAENHLIGPKCQQYRCWGSHTVDVVLRNIHRQKMQPKQQVKGCKALQPGSVSGTWQWQRENREGAMLVNRRITLTPPGWCSPLGRLKHTL